MVATATEKVGQMQTKSLSSVETLRAARKLIEKPESWTQGAYARDAYSRDEVLSDEGSWEELKAWDERAVCRCSLGAIYAASGNCDAPEAILFLRSAIVSPDFFIAEENDIVDWNDNIARTHAEVMAAFDHAISLAETNS